MPTATAYWSPLWTADTMHTNQFKSDFYRRIRSGPAGICTGTMLIPKPDPRGRFLLVDMRLGSSGLNVTHLCLTGPDAPEWPVAVVSFGDEESATRQHAVPGAFVKGYGLGAAAHMASAFHIGLTKEAHGVHSLRRSAFDRTPNADAVWKTLRKRGLATREIAEEVEIDPDTGEDIEVRYPVDYLPATAIKGLLAWTVRLDKPAGWARAGQSSDWSKPSTKASASPKASKLDRAYVKGPDFNYSALPRTAADMLARSIHGNSLPLSQLIYLRLRESHPDLASLYRRRKSIRRIWATAKQLDGLDDAPGPAHWPELAPETKQLIADWRDL